MRQRNTISVVILSVPLFYFCGPTFAQFPGSPNVGGPDSARSLSSPRSDLGFRSDPVANPSPSLTPNEVLHPRGSLDSGQVLNPKPSLNRPRTGGDHPQANRDSKTAAVRVQTARPIIDENTTGDDAGPSATQATTSNLPAGEQILIAVVALDEQLAIVAPNQAWSKRLSLDTLRTIPVLSDQPANDEQRAGLEKILKTYLAVEKEEQSTSVNRLPEFKRTLKTLQQYLSPLDVRRRKKALAAFGQIASDLAWYKNGADWAEYLVPPELVAGDGKSPPSKELLEKQLKRYAKVSGDPAYKKVYSLPGFVPAYQAVKSLASNGK
ncbi:hypothetical protein Q31b_17150 [Novipirellula aureliae]|uniref:Uncharacterized protein n=1 Tax=Novipirellula aureliae TaxID=2527966 RepID=A0A5C6EAK2_9BACT|nr:hypothetical protein [Novipirellula aureliae]TWU44179.1 hypothetical protein Q31b_17150 [Novipirellula aureliae]